MYTYHPGLRQVFFIGDGLTGTGTGTRQTFTAPTGATRLFIGIADAFNFFGDPGAYDDNTGAFQVGVSYPGAGSAISGHVRDAGAHGIAGVVVSADGASGTTGSDGAYTISVGAAGSYVVVPARSGYFFTPPSQAVDVPPDQSNVDFVGTPVGPGQTVIPGTTAIFLAGRTDVTIPPLGGDLTGFPLGRNCAYGDCEGFLLETFPVQFDVTAGAALTFAATGSVDYYGGQPPATGPDGDGESDIYSLAGISGHKGPCGAVVGVFLNNQNPVGLGPPATLDFTSAGLGTAFTTLHPGLRQVFFIGDGVTGTGTGARQTFTAPTGATRLFIGIADAFSFYADPGAYDDNHGAFVVTVNGAKRKVFLPLIMRH